MFFIFNIIVNLQEYSEINEGNPILSVLYSKLVNYPVATKSAISFLLPFLYRTGLDSRVQERNNNEKPAQVIPRKE